MNLSTESQFQPLPVRCRGWSAVVPEGRLTNQALEGMLDTSDAWIVERTGIRERRTVAPDETTATLGSEAARRALKDSSITPGEVGFLAVATSTPDTPVPHTGAYISSSLGVLCPSFDLNTACAGFVYSLVLAASYVTTGPSEHAVVVGADVYSRAMNYRDRATCVLFGDGAGATVVSRATEGDSSLLSWDLGCDGDYAHIVGIPAGGNRRPPSHETLENGEHYLQMMGRDVFAFAVDAIVRSSNVTLEHAGLTLSDVDVVVPHQANLRLIEAALAQLGVPPEKVILNGDRFGNTAAASIPIAMSEAVDDGRVSDGDIVLLCAVGAGMTWATALLRY